MKIKNLVYALLIIGIGGFIAYRIVSNKNKDDESKGQNSKNNPITVSGVVVDSVEVVVAVSEDDVVDPLESMLWSALICAGDDSGDEEAVCGGKDGVELQLPFSLDHSPPFIVTQ